VLRTGALRGVGKFTIFYLRFTIGENLQFTIDYLRFTIVKVTEGFGAKISGKFAEEKKEESQDEETSE
jgi:hypothetical protein